MDKRELINKIRSIEGLNNDEKSALIELLRKQKKYGLVWEDKPEDVEERLRNELPVLKEVKERAIISEDKDAPNHILIEGDNLEALTALSYTHAGKIDAIYIDPPYNTGNKDFIYNDSYVDSEDGYRHSKWLSFMKKRLSIAHRLLSDKGVIFISIDDNEQAQLKLLCDGVFGEYNKIGVLPTIMNLKGNQSEFGFAGTHEYTIVYAMDKSNCQLGNLLCDDEDLDSWEEDEIGYFKKGATLKRTGADAPREKRPLGYFPILVNRENFTTSSITDEEYQSIYNSETKLFDDLFIKNLRLKYNGMGYEFLLPIVNGIKCSWRWGFRTVLNNNNEIITTKVKNIFSLYKKQRPGLADLPSKKPKSVLYKAQYSSGNGTAQLQKMGLSNIFNNPKPLELITDFLRIGNCKNAIILDFFAGSGTTLHATITLNNEDGGHRQCILVTNNENKICEDVTYIRNKKVIEGYTTPKGEEVAGLKSNSLRYYKTDFISRDQTPRNMRALVSASTDLLCIKNDIYTEAPFAGKHLNAKIARYFDDGKQRMLVIYDERAIAAIVEMIKDMPTKPQMKVYTFAPSRYAFDDEFVEVADKVTLCALPAAIYDAYQRVLPKRRPQYLPEALAEMNKDVEQAVHNEPAQSELDFNEEGGEA